MTNKKTHKTKLEIVAEAHARGYKTGGQVAEATGVKADVAASYLTLLRKFDFDVERTREHINRTSNAWHTARYRSDPVWRAARRKSNRDWRRRNRERIKASPEGRAA